jgi:hypothetical protein
MADIRFITIGFLEVGMQQRFGYCINICYTESPARTCAECIASNFALRENLQKIGLLWYVILFTEDHRKIEKELLNCSIT